MTIARPRPEIISSPIDCSVVQNQPVDRDDTASLANFAPKAGRECPEHSTIPIANLCGIGRRSPILLQMAARIGLPIRSRTGSAPDTVPVQRRDRGSSAPRYDGEEVQRGRHLAATRRRQSLLPSAGKRRSFTTRSAFQAYGFFGENHDDTQCDDAQHHTRYPGCAAARWR